MRWYPAMSVSIWYTSWPRPTTPSAAAGISAAVLTRPILADRTGNIGGRLRRGGWAGVGGGHAPGGRGRPPAVPAGCARPGRLGHRGGHAARPGPARVRDLPARSPARRRRL